MMKADELQLNDWVRVTDDDTTEAFVGRVTALDLELGNVSVKRNGEETAYPFSIDCIEGIPTSPEILEKNGFEKSEYGWYNRKIVEWEIEIYIGRIETFVKINKGVYPHINNTDCRFLHQLQHALKLCEIEKEITL